MVLKVVEKKKHRDVHIKEGQVRIDNGHMK